MAETFEKKLRFDQRCIFCNTKYSLFENSKGGVYCSRCGNESDEETIIATTIKRLTDVYLSVGGKIFHKKITNS